MRRRGSGDLDGLGVSKSRGLAGPKANARAPRDPETTRPRDPAFPQQPSYPAPFLFSVISKNGNHVVPSREKSPTSCHSPAGVRLMVKRVFPAGVGKPQLSVLSPMRGSTPTSPLAAV